jgi:hypothetical protein
VNYTLPDGRALTANLQPDNYWQLSIDGTPRAEIVGWPLPSTLAELLGYAVAHEQWPSWIDELAVEIERSRVAFPNAGAGGRPDAWPIGTDPKSVLR